MTFQIRDTFIYEGEKLSVDGDDCPPIPENNPRITIKDTFDPDESLSCCWREYIATWEVKGGELYLVDGGEKYNLAWNTPIFFDWFSGEIGVEIGGYISEIESSDLSGIGYPEKTMILTIENGVVVGKRFKDNRTESWHENKKAAEYGDAEAQFNLGKMYYKGEGVARDYVQAEIWFTKVAEQGYAHAQFYLGNLYQKGYGVPQDKLQAVKWFTKAAEQGHAEAQFILGLCYYDGDGVLQDEVRAAKWFSKAAEQGHEDAQANIASIISLDESEVSPS